MQVSYFFTLISLAATSLAILVTSPSQGTTWTSSGTNSVTWTRVSTDPDNCAVILVQQGVFKQILAENVSTDKGSLTITSMLPVGNTYQVNLVKSSSPEDLNTILAQSAQFSITRGSVSPNTAMSGSATTAAVSTLSTLSGTSAVGSTTQTPSANPGSGTESPNNSNSALQPTGSNAASPSLEYEGCWLIVLAFLGAVLI